MRRAAPLLLAVLWLGSGCATVPCPPPPSAEAFTTGPSEFALDEPAEPGEVAASSSGDAAEAPLDSFDEDADFYDWIEEEEGPDPADRDSLESVNRPLHAFNEGLYRWVFDPIAKGYAFVVPEPARAAVRRAFSNLREPVVFLNDVLQLAPRQAGQTGARFVVNTTIGLAGLFDPATSFGLPGHRTDFGQTMAVYSTPPGPYLVVPVLGPSTARDAVGGLVDFVFSPEAWLLPAGTRVVINAGSGLATYDFQRERLDALRETSIDYYSALRSAYLMDRDAAVVERIQVLRCPAPE